MSEDQFKKRQKALGKRIKDLRVRAGYTSYAHFAIEHNLEGKSVWRWENGNISLKNLFVVADIHGIALGRLLEGIE